MLLNPKIPGSPFKLPQAKILQNLRCLLLAGVFAVPALCSGQEDVSQLTTNQIFLKVQETIQSDLVAAQPYLEEVLKRITDDPAVRENARFFLALSRMEEYRNTEDKDSLNKAIEEFKLFLSEFPQSERRSVVRLNLADSQVELGLFADAIENYKWVYDNTKDSSLRAETRTLLANTYIRADRAKEGLPVFQEAFERSVLDPELRSQAAAWLLQGYLSAGKAEEIVPYFQFLTGRREALFNPKFNINIIKAGDDLFDSGDYEYAVLFYAIVKERSEILDFYESRVRTLAESLRLIDSTSEQYLLAQSRLQQAEANLKAVREMPDYNAEVSLRVARVYLESGRSWEALWAHYHLYQDYPEHPQVEDFLFLAFTQAKLVGEDNLLEQLANDYLGEAEYDKYRDQVIVDLAEYYAKTDNLDKLTALVRDYLKDIPANEIVGAQLLNYLAIELLAVQQYADIYNYMDEYYKRFQGLNEVLESASYWRALSLIVMGNYADALVAFDEFIDKYDEGSQFYEDSLFRRAICLFGVDQVEQSEEEFTAFVEKYPESHLRGEAELYLGDLARQRGAFEEALEHYNLVYELAKEDIYISKAVFAISEIKVQMGKLDEAVAVLQKYIDDAGVNGQIGEAYYRMGKLYSSSGDHSKRFEVHLKAVRLLANDANRYSIDTIIREYVSEHQRLTTSYIDSRNLMVRLLEDTEFQGIFIKNVAEQYAFFNSDEGRNVDPNLQNQLMRDRESRKAIRENPEGSLNRLKDFYDELVNKIAPYAPEKVFFELAETAKAEEQSIKLMRMQMATDLLDDSIGQIRYTAEELQGAPPAVIIHEAAKYGLRDSEQAIALYNMVLVQHPFSDAVYDALISLAKLYDQMAETQFEEELYLKALEHYDQVIQRFAFKAKGGEHYLAKARILNILGRGDEAIDVLAQVIKNPAWRGRQHAEAHLQLGLANLELNLLAEAHGFFERLIVAYGGFKNHVALAYYWDLVTLERMGERQSFQQLMEEIRTRKDLVETEGFQKIKEQYEL